MKNREQHLEIMRLREVVDRAKIMTENEKLRQSPTRVEVKRSVPDFSNRTKDNQIDKLSGEVSRLKNELAMQSEYNTERIVRTQ